MARRYEARTSMAVAVAIIGLVSVLTLSACSYYLTISTPHPSETLEQLTPIFLEAGLRPCVLYSPAPPDLLTTWCDWPFMDMNVQNWVDHESKGGERLIIHIVVTDSDRGRNKGAAVAQAIENYFQNELPQAKLVVRRSL